MGKYRYKINDKEDRRALLTTLASAGYAVKVTEEQTPGTSLKYESCTDYWVEVDAPDEAKSVAECTCKWVEDKQGTWIPDCGGGPWEFMADGPTENSFEYCPFCGKTLYAVWPKGDMYDA